MGKEILPVTLPKADVTTDNGVLRSITLAAPQPAPTQTALTGPGFRAKWDDIAAKVSAANPQYAFAFAYSQDASGNLRVQLPEAGKAGGDKIFFGIAQQLTFLGIKNLDQPGNTIDYRSPAMGALWGTERRRLELDLAWTDGTAPPAPRLFNAPGGAIDPAPGIIGIRVWIVNPSDAQAKAALVWHKATQLPGDFVFSASSLDDAVKQMEKHGALSPNVKIQFLEFAGHGTPTSVIGLVELHNIRGQERLVDEDVSPQVRALRRIAERMDPDAEVRINACECGKSQDFMLELSRILGVKVTANTGWIWSTGKGTWLTTDSKGTKVSTDDRWGSAPGIARRVEYAANNLDEVALVTLLGPFGVLPPIIFWGVDR
jgi:hypothetical protein